MKPFGLRALLVFMAMAALLSIQVGLFRKAVLAPAVHAGVSTRHNVYALGQEATQMIAELRPSKWRRATRDLKLALTQMIDFYPDGDRLMFARSNLPVCLLLSALVSSLSLAPVSGAEPDPGGWKAGAASVAITPEDSMWMAGYAARNKPSEGKIHDLFAKAIALQDSEGTRLVIVTTDLIGIPRTLRDWLQAECGRRYDLQPQGLLLNASHTHCGPELRVEKDALLGLDPQRGRQIRDYMETLKEQLADLIGAALDDLAPAEISYTHGRAGFAMNRRRPTEQGVQNRPYPDGPVDHDVPVLRISSADGQLKAVLFGYACHNTTLGIYQFCGDYAGFTQQYLQEAHPGTMALFMAGCGGDQNPQLRRTVKLAQQHGRALANGVEAALLSPPRPIAGPLRVALEEVELQFADPPSRNQLERETKSKNRYERRHAEALLRQLDQSGEIDTTYPYLVQVIRFGDALTMVALAGEVVVDYSLRLKVELTETPVWVAGYSNDVFGYVPSLRVLTEGGYEGGGAMRYTILPGPFAPSVEKRILAKVHQLVDQVRSVQGTP